MACYVSINKPQVLQLPVSAVIFVSKDKEVLNKAGSMRLQSKMSEFKAKVAGNSTAIAQIFNAEIAFFDHSIENHDLSSAIENSQRDD